MAAPQTGSRHSVPEGLEIRGPVAGRFAEILTPATLTFVASLAL